MKLNNTSASNSCKVWIVGNSHPAADRSISWSENFPNISDPDVLILDLTTLASDVLKSVSKLWMQPMRLIADKFVRGGGDIVIITAQRVAAPTLPISTIDIITTPLTQPISPTSNYFLSPIEVYSSAVPLGAVIKFNKSHNFKMYLDAVEQFGFYITNATCKLDLKKLFADINYVDCSPVYGQEILDNAGHVLGNTFTLSGKNDGRIMNQIADVGNVILLPPPTESSADALGKILSVYGKTLPTMEARPDWAKSIQMPLVVDLQNEINTLTSKNRDIVIKIKKLKNKKETIMDHTKLLYSGSFELENAVKNAFQCLGFTEIKKRSAALEDWIFKFRNEKFDHGLVEVKGATKRTGEKDLTQCSKWTDKWFTSYGKLSKGIFVPNQHRTKPYLKSVDDRKHFEPNELEYAESKSICIIPSYVLFNSVCETLAGTSPDRDKIEQKIIDTNGVLESLL